MKIELKKNSLAHLDHCWIIGNGPSLEYTSLCLLKGEITIGFNGIGNIFEPTYYCLINKQLFEPYNKPFVEAMQQCKNTTFVITDNIEPCSWMERYHIVKRSHDVVAIHERFAPDFKVTYRRGTTLGELGIPLANYLGIKTIYMIGVDATLSGPNNLSFHGLMTKNEKERTFTKKEREREHDTTAKMIDHIKVLYEREGGKIYDCTYDPNRTIGWQFFKKRDYYETIDNIRNAK